MKSASYALINCVLILLPGAASFAGQTQLDSGESGRGGPIAKEVSQWVMHYYQKPQPEAFETRVRQMAQCNLLRSQEPVFLGRGLAQNPGRIAAWLDALQDLEEADRAVLSKAAWLSDAREARQWLEKMQIQEYAGKRPPDLFAGPRIITAGTLDEYWAWFFATGDIKPVRAIVGSFYGGAIQYPEAGAGPAGRPLPPQPDTNDAVPFSVRMANYRLFDAAVWSCLSLAKEHPVLVQHLKTIESQSPEMNPKQKAWLQHVIRLADR